MFAVDGIPVYEKAFGYADWENKTPNNNGTLFNIASITKMFTHVMILQLEREGKLNAGDQLSKYLSLYPEETGNKITIKMLLDMKAGLGDYLQDPEFNKNPSGFHSVNDFLDIIKNEPLLFEPGTSQRYSNSGYVVLGGIIEKITGKSYKENLKERILDPLGMNNTYFPQKSDVPDNAAIGELVTFSGEKKGVPFYASPSPAGGIYTNAEDLLKFDSELRSKYSPGEFNVIAGGTPAWNSILAQYNQHYTLIVLSNFGRMAEEVEKRVNMIVQGKDYPPPQPLPEMRFYKVIKENGIEYFKEHFKEILDDEGMLFKPFHLNTFGYDLMEEGDIDMAIDVFRINTELFPDIPNVWDSLGEAYMKKGDKEMAITKL